MNISIEKIDAAWHHIQDKCICRKTGIICDHIHANDPWHFPTPQEVRESYPNACGYGVGMEDGMINGGTMVDACLMKYSKTSDKNAADLAKLLVNGMLDAVFAAGDEGHVPRGIIPSDGKSCYVNSSRDQYTMFIFGMHRYYGSTLCEEEEKERIRKALISVARRFERNVTKENAYNILNNDGTLALAGQMWGEGMGNHEYLRMPMAYIAAWGVSGDEHWLELYRNLRAEAYERSKPMSEYWHLYALQQMQASVLVCYELENDEVWKEKYLSLMNFVADYTENKAGNVLNEISCLDGFNVPYCSFREASQELSKSMDDMGLAAICPRRADEHQFWVLQDAANLVIVPTYVPERKACSKAVEAFEQGFSKIDFSKYERCVPVHYLEGYYRNI